MRVRVTGLHGLKTARFLPYLIGMLPLALLLALAPAPVAADPLAGTWRNAGDSVRIRVAPCRGAPGMCGTVVAASEKARDDAAAGGTERLIGTALFRGFERGEDGQYAGTVFVPDIGSEVDGTLHLEGRDTLVAEGCLFAGFGCRAQRWSRVTGR
jgi:uncharacterized protein (DUF2147 family)